MNALSNPHAALGNGQHLGVAALVLAAALFSVQLYEPTGDPVSIGLNEQQQASMLLTISLPKETLLIVMDYGFCSSQVQQEFPGLEVGADHVIFRVGTLVRKAFGEPDGRSLRDAAESLSEYARAAQDMTVSLVGCSRTGPYWSMKCTYIIYIHTSTYMYICIICTYK